MNFCKDSTRIDELQQGSTSNWFRMAESISVLLAGSTRSSAPMFVSLNLSDMSMALAYLHDPVEL
jgi:hypothetical protein